MKVERREVRVVFPADAAEAKAKSREAKVVLLSSIDITMPDVDMHMLFAYAGGEKPSNNELEKGLSEVLCVYREWAGRIVVCSDKNVDKEFEDGGGRKAILMDNLAHLEDGGGRKAILMDDSRGVLYVEAMADFTLYDLSPFHPSPLLLSLIPPNSKKLYPDYLLLIQITTFSCGSWTLGIAWDHCVADGEALCQFLTQWSLHMTGHPSPSLPLHDRSSLFPRNPPIPRFLGSSPPPQPPLILSVDPPHLSVRKFHFSLSFLHRIKAEASSSSSSSSHDSTRYSTFVSLTSYLWKSITKAREFSTEHNVTDYDSSTMAALTVNLRKRIDPPIPDNYFGNAVCVAWPQVRSRRLLSESPLSLAAEIIHAAIRRISEEDYIRSVLDMVEIRRRSMGGVLVRSDWREKRVYEPSITVTSWVTLPMYDLDFGHGKPVFAGSPSVPFEGMNIMCRSPEMDGSIDVVIGLIPSDMERFQSIFCADISLH